MKTITLQQAIERATKGPFHVNRNPGYGEIVLNGSEIIFRVSRAIVTEASPTAALLTHFFNHGPELVKALQGMFKVHDGNAGLSGAEQIEILQSARALLSRVEKVEVQE